MRREKVGCWVGMLFVALAGCGGEDVGAPQGAAGGSGSGQTIASENSAVSDCGGFGAGTRGPVGYCDAEKLQWAHDPDDGTLSLMDARVMLNCCGEHDFDVYVDPDTGEYEAWVIDSPEMIEGTPARCNCSCVFDFKTDVTGVRSTSIVLRLMRHVTDQGAAKQVWSGTLDLSAGAGEIVLDDEPLEYGCAEY